MSVFCPRLLRCPIQRCASVPQSVAASTFISTWPGSSTGMRTFRISSGPLYRVTTATVDSSAMASSLPTLVARVDAGREQPLRGEPAAAHALLVGEPQEGVERGAILLDAVRPEVLAEQRAHPLRMRRNPWKRHMRRGDVGQALERAPLRFLECGEQV